MQNQNDYTGGVECLTLTFWLLPETQRQLAAITAAHNEGIEELHPDAKPMQSSEYLMARVVAWIEEEYKQNMARQQAAEPREKEHGQ
jgi:hypothetical protein